MKKLIVGLLTLVLTFGYVGIITKADSGQYAGMEWYTYNGNGVVDGSDNGVYYSLMPGNVSLVVTSTTGSNNNLVQVALRRARLGWDADYGTRNIKATGTYSWNVDATSSEYYLQAWSTVPNTWQSVYGYMHDH